MIHIRQKNKHITTFLQSRIFVWDCKARWSCIVTNQPSSPNYQLKWGWITLPENTTVPVRFSLIANKKGWSQIYLGLSLGWCASLDITGMLLDDTSDTCSFTSMKTFCIMLETNTSLHIDMLEKSVLSSNNGWRPSCFKGPLRSCVDSNLNFGSPISISVSFSNTNPVVGSKL